MKKISLDNIVLDDKTFKEFYNECFQLRVMIKDSDAKLKELQTFISDELLNKYILLKDNNSNELNIFLLENPMLSEFIDENKYNIILKEKYEDLLLNKIDLVKLNNGIECQHEFIKLNNHLMCIKCFIKEEELDCQDEDIIDFIVEIAKLQGMYIDEIDESELELLEKVRLNHKSLIEKLVKQRKNLSQEERINLDKTINNLEINKTIEYKNALKKLRKNKLSTKR